MAPDAKHRDSGAFGFRNKFFRFVGDTVDGAPSGYGVVYLADGGMLEGTFDGQGELTCPDGCRRWADASSYLGPFVRGEPHGRGRKLDARGDEYEGDFVCGLRHGEGQLSSRADRSLYVGSFRDNHFHGPGRLRVEGPMGYEIQGSFADGLPHGVVTARYANGDSYEGNVQSALPVGQGVFYAYATGVSYDGRMAAGKRLEVPSAINVVDVLVHGKATALAGSMGARLRVRRKPGDGEPRYVDQLAANDRHFTAALNLPFDVKVGLQEMKAGRAIDIKGVLGRAAAGNTLHLGPLSASKNMKLHTSHSFTPQTSESGRRIRCTAFAIPDGAAVCPIADAGAKNEQAVEAGRKVPLAHRGVSAQDIVRAITAATGKSTSFHNKANATKVPKGGRLPSLVLSPDVTLPPHDEVLEARTVNGEATFHVNLLSAEPGDYMLRFEVQCDKGVQMTPGDPASFVAHRGPPLVAYMPVHVVRQC